MPPVSLPRVRDSTCCFIQNACFLALVYCNKVFLCIVFVEKVLRVQPNVKKLYLLLRADDTKSATQRLQFDVRQCFESFSDFRNLRTWVLIILDFFFFPLDKVLEKELFRVLKERCGEGFSSLISDKVIAIAGDITVEDLGLKDSELRERMWDQIDVIVNLAATTNFDER